MRVAVGRKAIRANDEQYRLCAAVDPKTNRILHPHLFLTRTIPILPLAEKYDAFDAVFLVDGADDLKSTLCRENLSFRAELRGGRNSLEYVVYNAQLRKYSFSDYFNHVDLPTAETRLRPHIIWWNRN